MARFSTKIVGEGMLEEAYSYCEKVAAKSESSLYLTSTFFKDNFRYRAFCSMYAAMRIIDDMIDNSKFKGKPATRFGRQLAIRIAQWRDRLAACYNGVPQDSQIDKALADTFKRFPIPKQLWAFFLDSMSFDLEKSRFDDFEEFLDYAQGATVAPTTIFLYLITATPKENSSLYTVDDFLYRQAGEQLGIWAYLLHILRDVKKDINASDDGLVYLSLQDLEKYSLSVQDLREFSKTGKADERYKKLASEILSRAETYGTKGRELVQNVLPRLPPDRKFILMLIIELYSELGKRLAKAQGDVFDGREILSPIEQKTIAAKVAVQCGFNPF